MKENDKKMGLFSLITQCIGYIIGGGIFTMLPIAILYSGRSAFVAIILALLFGLLLTIPSLFLSSTVQLDGGYYTQAMLTLPKRLGGACTFMLLFSMIGFSSYPISMANYLLQLFPFAEEYQKFIAMAILILFFLLGIFGSSAISKAQNVMVVLLLVAMSVYIVGGLTHLEPGYFSAPGFFAGGFGGIMGATGLLTMATLGGGSIVNYTQAAKNPKRDIPLAILIGTMVVALFYLLIVVVATGVAPIEQLMTATLGTSAEMVLSRPLYLFFMIGGALFALGSSLNSVLGYLPYPFVQAAQDGWLPKAICKQTKGGYYWVLMLILFVVGGCGPILLGLPIETVGTFFAIPSYIAQFFFAIACFSLPKKFQKAWLTSNIHVPNWIFYPVIILSAGSAIYLAYNMLSMLGTNTALIGLGLVAALYIYCTVLDKKNLVHTEYIDEMKSQLTD